jgi:MoaA/NifB/PqqE/SkfB family radical SAM enzyme
MFCPMPYQQMHVREDGEVHLCCPGWLPRSVGNVLETSPLDIWKGDRAQEIRSTVTNGDFRYCERCPFLPGPAGCVTEKGSPPEVGRIPLLCLSHDPTCNLRCGSCRKENRTPSPTGRLVQAALLASSVFHHVDCLYALGGGDPLASQLFWDLIGDLPADSYPHLELYLHTNGQLLDDRAWQRLGSYTHHLAKLEVSVDAATPDTYRKLRLGGELDRLLENLSGARAMMERCSACRIKGLPLHLKFTVQAENYREVPAFVDLGESLGAKMIMFTALENWGTYDEDEYAKRAVHRPSHPEHGALLQVLRDPRLTNKHVATAMRIAK